MTERDHRNPERDDHIDFKKLVFEHQDRVLNTCYRFVHNREDVEDVAQEIFMEVHRSIGVR